MSNSVLFSSRSFMVSGLAFRSLIRFEFTFPYGVESVLISFRYMWRSFCQHLLLKKPSFPFADSCLLCCRLIDHMYVGLFLGFLSCPTDLYVYFCASTILVFVLFCFFPAAWHMEFLHQGSDPSCIRNLRHSCAVL